MIYPVITLKQPWCGWVLSGLKPVETRVHKRFKSLVGKTFLIHSSLGFDGGFDASTATKYLDKKFLDVKEKSRVFKSGAILGGATAYAFGPLNKTHFSVSLIDCESTNRYGLWLKDPFLLHQPIEEKGELNIWYYDLLNRRKVKKPVIDTGTLFEF